MLAPVLFYLAALTVKQDQTPLRSGCSTTDEEIVRLPEGTKVEIRFAIADGSNCFKVAAAVDGSTVIGYVAGDALKGVDRFEQDRASAPAPDGVRMMTPVESLSKAVSAKSNDPTLARASQLLRENQPAQALQILEPLAKRYANNPDLLLLTGLAAYRNDQAKAALDYWKQSLDLQPNPMLAQLYAKVQQEAAADKSGEKLFGTRFVLRYEGQALPAETARQVVAVLDSEFARISAQLGCPAEEKIVAIVQSREAFLKSTGASEWAAGQYDGRIRVALLDGAAITPQTQRALAHEIVHACLTNIPSGSTPWPSWLQEGLAQKLSGDQLTSEMRAELREKAQTGALPKLERLGQNWSGFAAGRAQTAYHLALAAADALFEYYQNYGIRNVLNNPDRLPQITADLDRKLGL
jgi:hypothetical protein